MEGCNADDKPGKGGGEEEMRQTQGIRHIRHTCKGTLVNLVV